MRLLSDNRIFALLCVHSLLSFVSVICDGVEYALMRTLMENYDSSIRPAKNSTQSLKVEFGVSLHHIIDVDEKNQILTTNCWITQVWTDHHLLWNISDFDEITVLRIPYHKVWRPDIILYNNADSQYNSAVINTNVIVKHDGEVTWLSHGIYRSSCDIDVEYFPFDIQSCAMKWASWTYDGYMLDLVKQTEEGDVSNYQANGEFDLIGFDSIKNVITYSCCEEPYPDITYFIRLRRRPMFYVFNLILPCILINCIGMYYGVSICLVTLASGLSVVTLNIYHRGVRGTKVPGIIKATMLGKLARCLFLQFEPRKKNSQEARRCGPKMQVNYTKPDRWTTMNDEYRYNSPKFIMRHSAQPAETNATSTGSRSFETQFMRMLQRVNVTVEQNELRLLDQERREQTELEWKQVALVMDRLLLWIFIILTAISTTVILRGSPYGP
ncbi:neuronal acetylcholine receptor subunit alpha-9 isoform X2 [Bemisia tabaci]|uniref:neuronal acetylcholine receptor subunit alpha-9 isoform X2 n=1 Tax=Bemisia tabaci TaxID=7038 RepID=UPI003B28C1EF